MQIMTQAEINKAYGWAFKHWRKAYGEKPTALMLNMAHAFGMRAGTKVALANAMYLRQGGASSKLVSVVCGGPQLNVFYKLVDAKLINRTDERGPDGKVTHYRATITARGKAHCAALGLNID